MIFVEMESDNCTCTISDWKGCSDWSAKCFDKPTSRAAASPTFRWRLLFRDSVEVRYHNPLKYEDDLYYKYINHNYFNGTVITAVFRFGRFRGRRVRVGVKNNYKKSNMLYIRNKNRKREEISMIYVNIHVYNVNKHSIFSKFSSP